MTAAKQPLEEKLAEFLDSLDCPVIVEGKRDHEALLRHGLKENPRPRELFAKLRVGGVEGLRPALKRP